MMAEFQVNKGIGRDVEFHGLRSQYLFIFAGGLLGVFIILVIMFMAEIRTMVCIATGIVSGTTLVWLTFRLNSRYGAHGLMKLTAAKRHPRRIIHRKSMGRLMGSGTASGKVKEQIYEK